MDLMQTQEEMQSQVEEILPMSLEELAHVAGGGVGSGGSGTGPVAGN
jgi:hypothetical protein